MDISSITPSSSINTTQSTRESLQEEAESASFTQELSKAQKAMQTDKTAEASQQDKKLRDACQGFEAMFLDYMYSKMRDTVPKDELFGNSNADEIWSSMRDSEMMKRTAAAGGVGLSDMLYKQLKPQVAQEAQTATTAKK